MFQFSRKERASFSPDKLKRKSLATQSKHHLLSLSSLPFVMFVLHLVVMFRFVLGLSTTQHIIFLGYIHINMIKKEEVMFIQYSATPISLDKKSCINNNNIWSRKHTWFVQAYFSPFESVLQPDSSNQGDNSRAKAHKHIHFVMVDGSTVNNTTHTGSPTLARSQWKYGYYLSVRIVARTHLPFAITYYTMTMCEHFVCVLAISCWPAHCDISSSGILTLQCSLIPPPHHHLTLPTAIDTDKWSPPFP